MIDGEGKAGRKAGERWAAILVPSPAASNRRHVVGRIGAALLAGTVHAAGAGLRVLGQDVAIRIAPVSPHTVRLSVLPIKDGKTAIRR